jgi:hypothetical protein
VPLILVVVSVRLILVAAENLTTYDSQDIDHILETLLKEEGETHILSVYFSVVLNHEELSDPWKDSITSYLLHCFASL